MKKTEFATIRHTANRTINKTVMVSGWVLGHWGVFKTTLDNYCVVYIPLGTALYTVNQTNTNRS